MRILTSILCLAIAGQVLSAEMYRWKDKDGVVHYSDQPNPGAEKLPMTSAPPPGSVAPSTQSIPSAAPLKPFEYTLCEINSPSNDQVFNAVNAVSVSVSLQPALQSDHRVTMQVNGRVAADWPPTSTSYLLQNLSRGSYSVMAIIVDGAGRTLCTSKSAISFHVRQPSMLTPGARTAPRS
ncbi:MAG: DUF4124 domain-containing protein [Steroidobacteraceae bacterium]